MSYLTAGEPSLKLLKTTGHENEQAEYQKLIGQTNSTEDEIPSFWHKNIPDNLEKSHCQMMGQQAAEHILNKVPDDEELEEIFHYFSFKNSQIIKYDENRFKKIIKDVNFFLISEKTVKLFVSYNRYFNFGLFREYIKLLCKLFIYLSRIVRYSTNEGLLLDDNNYMKFVEEFLDDISSFKFIKYNNITQFYLQYFCVIIQICFDPYQTNSYNPFQMVCSSDFISFFNIEEETGKDNIFSYESFLDIYNQFYKLSKEGLITKSKLKNYQNHKLTDAFIERVFEVSSKYGDEKGIDFFGFLMFHLNFDLLIKHPNSGVYLFRLFDIDGDGVVSPFDLSFFFKDCMRESRINQVIDFDNFVKEMFDRLNANLSGFTIEQFCKSPERIYVTYLLADYSNFVKGFIEEEEDDDHQDDDSFDSDYDDYDDYE
ncbi:EF hand family protein [Histomonas meleagridis]|uniref:EF hand family protein n=1 Tax=Histomonas meleagridis TaxID=135588 RepID=UPI00355A1339|nr:EF hand family protein [Histomonas meleagridis]KAH0796692.1 EF hand family protein [Histomonas meleagridis]